MGFVPPKKI